MSLSLATIDINETKNGSNGEEEYLYQYVFHL